MVPCKRPARSSFPLFTLAPRAIGSALAVALLGAPLAAAAREESSDAAILPAPPLDAPPLDVPPLDVPPLDVIAEPDSVAETGVTMAADGARYDSSADVLTVTGNVILHKADRSIRADQVSWDRKAGTIRAEGNVRFVDANGNQLLADRIELDDQFRAGAMENLLLVLRLGGRLAASQAERTRNGQVVLHQAAYSACAVENGNGCPRKPSWRITARRVLFDPARQTARFIGARAELFGVRLLPMPGLALATDGRPISGLLIPSIELSASNGVHFSESWYQRLGPNRDLSLTGYVFTRSLPMISAQYRQLTSEGAFQITGFATRSARIPIGTGTTISQHDFRGYLFANGRMQFSPEWSATITARIASDRTFLRRYDISRDDRLRSSIALEHIDRNSYFSFTGWATQTLRSGDNQGQVPIALPEIDYRRRFTDPLGGLIQLQFNSLAVSRIKGQDSQRAFAGVQWDLRRLTRWGQELTFTALMRGDLYHSDQNRLTDTLAYQGLAGWQTRGLATAALDLKWPLVGGLMGGTQVLTPWIQLVASPNIGNLAVPNEDARAIELEDSNLFALNRFPGYDRVEDGVRFTYGLEWQWNRPDWRISTLIGKSFRLTDKTTLLPSGTGLNSRASDIVGRTELRFKDVVTLTHRFRLDKDNLTVRRNEFDAALGTRRTYLELGYLRLNRDITSGIEDLKDREELRLAARAGFARYWSLFGSGVFDLTGRSDDQAVSTDGFQPIRTRLGVAYEDDCLEFDLTWRRDYVSTGDARRGNTYQLRIAVRNLGFR